MGFDHGLERRKGRRRDIESLDHVLAEQELLIDRLKWDHGVVMCLGPHLSQSGKQQ